MTCCLGGEWNGVVWVESGEVLCWKCEVAFSFGDVLNCVALVECDKV